MEPRCVELFRDWTHRHEDLWAKREQLSDTLVHSLPDEIGQAEVESIVRLREEIEPLERAEQEAWSSWRRCVKSQRLRRVG